jgi:hypothetical protein
MLIADSTLSVTRSVEVKKTPLELGWLFGCWFVAMRWTSALDSYEVLS